MNIWIITIGEPLPSDKGNTRLLRTGILANLLVQKEHSVIWWTSTYDHVKKRHRFGLDTVIDISNRFKLVLMYAPGYKRNVSFNRLVNHCYIALKFDHLSVSYRRPDVILCSLPTLELGLAATGYGKRHGIPVVLDVRDLWPDIFLSLVPSWGRCFAKKLLSPLYATVRKACRDATIITGITPAFVEWGLQYANRRRHAYDRDFPLGYSETVPEEEQIDLALRLWAELGVKKDDFNICFFGTIGRQFDLDTVITAAQKLEEQHRPIRFILCGDGDKLSEYRKKAVACRSILFPGWVNSADIWTLMRMSRLGLAPYYSTTDFTMSLPNKSFEYLSAGLPVVSSLQGSLKQLLAEHECGTTYKNGDAQELVSVLIRLYDEPAILQTMSQNSLSLYRDKFTADKVYGDMITQIEEIVRKWPQLNHC